MPMPDLERRGAFAASSLAEAPLEVPMMAPIQPYVVGSQSLEIVIPAKADPRAVAEALPYATHTEPGLRRDDELDFGFRPEPPDTALHAISLPLS